MIKKPSYTPGIYKHLQLVHITLGYIAFLNIYPGTIDCFVSLAITTEPSPMETNIATHIAL